MPHLQHGRQQSQSMYGAQRSSIWQAAGTRQLSHGCLGRCIQCLQSCLHSRRAGSSRLALHSWRVGPGLLLQESQPQLLADLLYLLPCRRARLSVITSRQAA